MNSTVRWVIQKNLIAINDLEQLKKACEAIHADILEVEIIPFSGELPAIPVDGKNIYYGSTTFNNLVHENEQLRKGLFFDPDSFSIANYMQKWGPHMLNYGASITTFRELMSAKHAPDKLLFIRPDADNKSFAGEVMQFDQIGEWYEKLLVYANENLSPDTSIIVSEPYNIKYEWRLWIVGKKVITASKYREEFRLSKQRGCPPAVTKFAEARCNEYTPHDIFVMDICQCGDDLYIVECGCTNAAGFYHADINKIVRSVSDYFTAET
jgi:hypothetical protein